MVNGRLTVTECETELSAFFATDSPITSKREERLRDAELQILAGQKGLYYASELLNQQMTGRQIPMFIIFMLQGAWFEFLQEVFVHCGRESSQWTNVCRLTEALIWSLQPNNDKEKQQEIIQSLPNRVRKFCDAMEFDTEQVVASLADVEAEYEAIQSGDPSDGCDFDLMDVDATMGDADPDIDAKLLKRIARMDQHQWFLYEDTSESKERVARIKLILNWSDSKRMLFTNHNRRKVMHMTYAELAAHLENKTVRQLNHDTSSFRMIGSHLLTVLQNVSRQNKMEKKAKAEERRKLSTDYVESRQQELSDALAQHQELAKLKEDRARVLRQKSQQKYKAAVSAVDALRADAWVKLPVMEGTLTPCKLVAIIPGNDNYIFTNRAGLRVAEYTGRQLAHMIVTENSEIVDTGEEFEDVLASVVVGLRENKDKSYEELTGDTS